MEGEPKAFDRFIDHFRLRRLINSKITLLDTRPPIWRRVLAQLHEVLQTAMEWENCHLHKFRIGRQRFGTAP